MYLSKIIYLFEWLILIFNSIKFRFIMYFDYIRIFYLRTVLIITGIVIFYRIDYIWNDLYIYRFKYLVFLFIISICLIILSPRILGILLGWDGLGLISYCLVIYYQNKNSYNSGILVICCNRIGDIGLILIILILSFLGSWNLFIFEINLILGFLILLIILTKRAQLPFSYWLPVAITAPTPVSSLVHSSTLVTAGVYLLIRYNYIFIDLLINGWILIIFSLTILIAGILANFEMNFKKIIALSTLSQLGFIIRILSIGLIDLGFFHLIIHAFFKSMIFIRVGGLIHINLNIQDLRIFGMIFYLNPFKRFLLILSILNLCGFPFVSGFFSKDLILEGIFNINLNLFNLYILYFSILLTLRYSFRLLKFILFNNKNYFSFIDIGEFYKFMNFVFFFLILFRIFLGNLYYIIFIKDKFISIILDKIILLKLYIYSFYFFKFFDILNLKDWIKLIKFLVNILYLVFFIKVIYLKLFEFILKYEIHFEKSIEKLFSINFILLILYFNKFLNIYFKIKFINFVYLINIYIIFLFSIIFLI